VAATMPSRAPESGGPTAAPHVRLSAELEEILRDEAGGNGLTMNSLIRRTHGRGIYLVMILLSLPFLTPIPLPGLSNFVGVVLLVLAVRLALDLPPRLPRFIGARALSPKTFHKVVAGSLKTLRFIEKVVRPRRTAWLNWRAARIANALLLAAMACVLALPFPPIPFTNSLPALAIVLAAASMMEEDGVMIWAGYAAALGTVIYLASAAGVIVGLTVKYLDQVLEFLRSLA
jgi:hypothetical protein